MPSNSQRGPPIAAKIRPPSKPPICPQLSMPGDMPMNRLTAATITILLKARCARLPKRSLFRWRKTPSAASKPKTAVDAPSEFASVKKNEKLTMYIVHCIFFLSNSLFLNLSFCLLIKLLLNAPYTQR